MTKEEIAGVLEQIATLLELKGENPFKIRAYANAARAIETFGGNISNLDERQFRKNGQHRRAHFDPRLPTPSYFSLPTNNFVE